MSDLTFLVLTEVLEIHADQIKRYGGDSGIRDIGLLESAIAMPQSSFGGEYLHPTIFKMAAAYAYHIAENQPFLDGNKRTALASALIFLEMNNKTLDDPEGELYDAMIKIGTHQMIKEQLADLFRRLAKN